MGEPMEPTNQAPSPTSTPALSFLLSKNALDASRTEILVLASGILFLASQVCLLVWILRRTGTAPHKKEQRKVAIVIPAETNPPSPATADAHDDVAVSTSSDSNGKDKSPLRLRRRSSWGGRSAYPGTHNLPGRRKSAGSRRSFQDGDGGSNDEEEKAGAQTSLSNPGPEPKLELEPEAGRDAPTALGDMGRLVAALAMPATPPLPSTGGAEGGEDGEDTELRDFDARRALGEAGVLGSGASIVKPPSPRSPRVLAADQAAMMDALYADDEDADRKAAAPSPMAGAEVDVPALAYGFEDPLGVNRLVEVPAGDEEGHGAVELEPRDGGRRDV